MKQKLIQVRATEEEKKEIENKAKEFGFTTVSEYLRYIGRNCKEIKIKINE